MPLFMRVFWYNWAYQSAFFDFLVNPCCHWLQGFFVSNDGPRMGADFLASREVTRYTE